MLVVIIRMTSMRRAQYVRVYFAILYFCKKKERKDFCLFVFWNVCPMIQWPSDFVINFNWIMDVIL